ncbi:MAG: glycosyltransferase [Pseudochelatococcus sp.]|jgi:glycosyltransferase involved in cell wall biosynthesis/GT2 family glycosyltransferase|uniref:glycosyltransferase n=1 Tax=Pseudochelatococcus sp. TaxID=2020869 RepID=UPI003D8C5DA2
MSDSASRESASFAVNGRFLSQNVTGVQRYARNVVAALDDILADRKATARLIAPPGIENPGLKAMTFVSEGPLSGHPWEQLVLPRLWAGRLLNLGNTAPAAKADQIVCIHDANVFVAHESYGGAFRRLYSVLQPLLVRRSARIVTVSQASARQIARHLPIRAADIAVLPNGHEHALAWDPALARIAPPVVESVRAAGRRFVLALGSQARHKNLQLLARLAPGLAARDIDIVIAGGDAGIFAPETLHEAPNLRVIGRVSDHDLACLMDHALCLVFPSWTEGFGLPIVEAMARNCPVVSSDRASMPEVCGDAALLASPEDPDAWIGRIDALAGSEALREDLAGRGRERVRLFSWSATAAGYLDLLHDPARRVPAHAAPPPTDKVAVVVATRGRPETVSITLRHLLATQTLKPVDVVVSCVDVADAGDLTQAEGVRVVTGPGGLPTQRNTALAALKPGMDVVAFFDDDFVAHEDWLAVAARTFRDESSLAGFTGRVLADGVKGPGIGFEEAVGIVESSGADCDWSWIEPYSPYGCNMAFRASAIGEVKFDERLVLYGWLEDRDFAGELAKSGGRFAKCADARGVHMGTKGGRVSGERFGYSQIVNPIYMMLKKTMTPGQVVDHIFRNVTSNVLRSARPEAFIDRRGRLRGNLLGVADLLRGRIEPEKAAAIGAGGRK